MAISPTPNASMPGRAELRSAQPGKLRVQYRELPIGAEIEYTSDDPILIDAVHRWFDAQVTEHGRHAMPGRGHGMMQPRPAP